MSKERPAKRKRTTTQKLPKAKRRKVAPKTKLDTSPVQIVNLNEFARNEKLWKNKHALVPQGASRTCVVAPSGYGKSTMICGLILQYIVFDQLWIFAKMPDEQIYDVVRRIFAVSGREFSSEPNPDGSLPDLFISNNVDLVPALTKIPRSKQTVIIFDDMITEKTSKQKQIEELFTMGRKQLCSTYYLSQHFTKIPTLVRDNCDYHVFFGLPQKRRLRDIAEALSGHLGSDRFKEVFEEATAEPHEFLFVDSRNKNKAMRYRRGFNQCLG